MCTKGHCVDEYSIGVRVSRPIQKNGRTGEVRVMTQKPPLPEKPEATGESCPEAVACPVCGGHLVEIRGKLQCARCRTICETCCEGGRG